MSNKRAASEYQKSTGWRGDKLRQNDVYVKETSSITSVGVRFSDSALKSPRNVVLTQDKFVVGTVINIAANTAAKLFDQGFATVMQEQKGVRGDTLLRARQGRWALFCV